MGVVSITFPGNLMQVSTADGLRALPSFSLTNGQIAGVVELASEYAWDPASTAADDGETVIRPTDVAPLQAGRWRLYSGTGIAVGGGGGAKAATIAELKAAKIESSPVALTAEGLEGTFYFTLGDFTGQTDDINIVEQDDAPLTTGAWVRQSAASVSFQAVGDTARRRTTQSELQGRSVDVNNYYEPTDNDFTAAFDRAVATGKTVFVPTRPGGYPVSNIAWVDNMQIVGEKAGECLGPELVVNANNTAAFFQPTSAPICVHSYFDNLTVRAAPGVVGARGWKSADKSKYSAYCEFRNIETHTTLACSYDALFIFAEWWNVRDGYLGGNPAAHQFLSSQVAAYGQTNATNTNRIYGGRIFNNRGVNAAIEVDNGDDWLFLGTRFENMGVPIFVGRSARNIKFYGIRAEGITTTELFTMREMAGSGVGSTGVCRDGLFYVDAPNIDFVNTDTLSRFGFDTNEASILGAGASVCNNPLALTQNDNWTVNGVGGPGFLTGTQANKRSAGVQYYHGAGPTANPAVSTATDGVVAATKGFGNSGPVVSVGGTFVTIYTPGMACGLISIGGAQAGGTGSGTPCSWVVNIAGGLVVEITGARITPGNSVVAEFQMSGGNLQMRSTAAGVNVTTVGFATGAY